MRRKSSDERASRSGSGGGAAVSAVSELRTIAEEKKDFTKSPREGPPGRTAGQEGLEAAAAAAAPSARDARAASFPEGGEVATGEVEKKALTKSVSMGGRSSGAGEKTGPPGQSKKKSVVYGAGAARASEAARPGAGRGRLGVRGLRESAGFGPATPTQLRVKKAAQKAGWLVPLFKSSQFVPMFDVPHDGPLLTSRRSRAGGSM